MGIFRNHTPVRQVITTKVSDHKKHRENLQIDFKNRCAYCDDIAIWRVAWYEVDHFVPRKHLKTILPTDYSNLVFACRSCNNAKWSHWPTLSETEHNKNDEGFIDPCDQTYNDQFSRRHDGRIIPETNLGSWMYNTLKLYKPQHEIIWNIEQLDSLIDEVELLLATFDNETLKSRLLGLLLAYRNYTKQLGGS